MLTRMVRLYRPTLRLQRNLCVWKIDKDINKCSLPVRNTCMFVPGTIRLCLRRDFCQTPSERHISSSEFEEVCSKTLDSLTEYFEDLVDTTPHLKSADITFGDGVLTLEFGSPYGTYVINRQSPNKQIWLSSPTSGPKRYDFVSKSDNAGCWIYKHDGKTLHQILKTEIGKICGKDIDLSKCAFSS